MVQPMDYKIEKTEFAVGHTKLQKTDLRKYFKQYGANIEGLTYFMHRHPARMMYRLATRV